jgi:hypothetical protein
MTEEFEMKLGFLNVFSLTDIVDYRGVKVWMLLTLS